MSDKQLWKRDLEGRFSQDIIDALTGDASKDVLFLLQQLEAAQTEITELKSRLWAAKDSQLRTYDGLAQKADRADELEKLLEAARAEIERLKNSRGIIRDLEAEKAKSAKILELLQNHAEAGNIDNYSALTDKIEALEYEAGK